MSDWTPFLLPVVLVPSKGNGRLSLQSKWVVEARFNLGGGILEVKDFKGEWSGWVGTSQEREKFQQWDYEDAVFSEKIGLKREDFRYIPFLMERMENIVPTSPKEEDWKFYDTETHDKWCKWVHEYRCGYNRSFGPKINPKEPGHEKNSGVAVLMWVLFFLIFVSIFTGLILIIHAQ